MQNELIPVEDILFCSACKQYNKIKDAYWIIDKTQYGYNIAVPYTWLEPIEDVLNANS